MSKRTPEQAKTFFKRNTKNRGNGRELYCTPESVIENIVESLLQHKPELKERIWIDPCAGDGRWGKVIQSFGIKCFSFDIKPLSNDVMEKDFLTFEYGYENLFFIGNPPFSLLKQFISNALSITDMCYFLGGSQIITGTLSDKVELLHRFEGFEGNQKDKRSKIKFTDTNTKQVLVWCCGGLFSKDKYNKFNRVATKIDNSFCVGIKAFCVEDKRVITIKNNNFVKI